MSQTPTPKRGASGGTPTPGRLLRKVSQTLGHEDPLNAEVLDAVPDGWAKKNGVWFEIEVVNWHPAACRFHNEYHVSGAGSGAVLMPLATDRRVTRG